MVGFWWLGRNSTSSKALWEQWRIDQAAADYRSLDQRELIVFSEITKKFLISKTKHLVWIMHRSFHIDINFNT